MKPSSSKGNIQHFKDKNFFTFFYFLGHFWIGMRIRIQPTKSNVDPNPEQRFKNKF